MNNKILPVHHSLADWDFTNGAAYRSLSADRFISAPSSLRYLKSGAYWYDTALCRIPGTQCLPQGEVRHWFWTPHAAILPALFRNQAPLGSSNFLNCYGVQIRNDYSILYRLIAGAYSERDRNGAIHRLSEWTHWRIFWYNGETPGGAPALCVDIYREITGEWVKQSDTMYCTDNTWEASATNRAGFRAFSSVDVPMYIDDTEIWGPV